MLLHIPPSDHFDLSFKSNIAFIVEFRTLQIGGSGTGLSKTADTSAGVTCAAGGVEAGAGFAKTASIWLFNDAGDVLVVPLRFTTFESELGSVAGGDTCSPTSRKSTTFGSMFTKLRAEALGFAPEEWVGESELEFPGLAGELPKKGANTLLAFATTAESFSFCFATERL